jgi:hypothetical protein
MLRIRTFVLFSPLLREESLPPVACGFDIVLYAWTDNDEWDFPVADVPELPAGFLFNVRIAADVLPHGFQVGLFRLKVLHLLRGVVPFGGEAMRLQRPGYRGVDEVASRQQTAKEDEPRAALVKDSHRP